MKYKVGDKVRIIENWEFVEEVEKTIRTLKNGRFVTIKEV
ncbi:hypothetical protein LCGC14_2752800, partial [marine sediment metagenome]